MKYFTYFIFAAFVVVTILFLKNALQPAPETISLTGSDKCGVCHSLQISGNQQLVWQNSKHSKAYKDLLGEKAASFTTKNGLEQASTNKLCLKCHTTEFYLNNPEKQASFKIDEGVGCESCHGAGSKYSAVEVMKDPYQYRHNGGLKPDEQTCVKCHSLKGNKEHKLSNDICPFQENDFVYKTYFDKIIHPVNKNNF